LTRPAIDATKLRQQTSEAGMCALMTMRNWLLFTLVCAGLAGYLAWAGWPTLPLDSGVDPATVQVHQAAVMAHLIKHALLGIGLPLLVLIIGRVACGRRPERL
jgi:hypothetical protein